MSDETSAENLQPHESFEDRVKRERLEWSERVQKFAGMIKHMDQIADLQVEVFSNMARLADYRRGLASVYNKKITVIKDKKAIKIEEIHKDAGIRYTSPEKTALIEAYVKDDTLQADLLNGHVEFMNDIYSILDKMVYSIKYRLELEKYVNI